MRLIKPKSIMQRRFSLKEYYDKRNSILILRSQGGLGDILMHRMMFEDVKILMPDARVCFACPRQFHEAVKDHPYIDELLDSDSINPAEYVQIYNTSSACVRHEMMVSPLADKNRSDIWANYFGLELTKHEMHVNLEQEVKDIAKKEVESCRNADGPAVLFTPISAMYNKNLNNRQTTEVVGALRAKGYYVYSSHTGPIEIFSKIGVPVLQGNIRKWMGYVYAADYVISVDTATVHLAGGIKKPLVGIFTFTDGKVYMKYYPTAELVQKHRDDGNWSCGPCYNWVLCPKTEGNPKPCLTQITSDMIMLGVDKMVSNFPKL